MSDRQSTTMRTAERGADESEDPRGFARPWIGKNVRRRPRHRDVPVTVRRLAVAVLCACLLTVPVLPASGTSHVSPAEPDARPTVENRTTPGGALSATLVTHEARVAGSLQASIVEVDLTTSPSDRARAHRLAAFEGTLAEQLGWLQERVRTHAAGNGSVVDRPVHTDVVRTRARALALRDLAERANQTVASLPENSTRSAGLDDGDFEAVARSSQALAENGSDRPDDPDGERGDERDDDRYDRHSPFLIDDPDRDGFAPEPDGGDPWHDDARAEERRANWSDAPSTGSGWPWVDSWQSGLWHGDDGDSDTERWNWSSHDGDGWNWSSHDEDDWGSTGHHEDAASEDDTDAADADDYGRNGSYTDDDDRSHFGDDSENGESGPEHDVEDGFPTEDDWSDDGDAAESSSDPAEPWPGGEQDDGSSPYFGDDVDDTDDADVGDGGDRGDEYHDGTTYDGPDGDANDGGMDDGATDESQTDEGDADERWYHGGGDHDGQSYDGAHSYGGETADDGDWAGAWGGD